jgi:hypothetical protein
LKVEDALCETLGICIGHLTPITKPAAHQE